MPALAATYGGVGNTLVTQAVLFKTAATIAEPLLASPAPPAAEHDEVKGRAIDLVSLGICEILVAKKHWRMGRVRWRLTREARGCTDEEAAATSAPCVCT